MEAIDESDVGYPEEQPPGAQPGDAQSGSAVRKGATADDAADRAPDNDDGTATGNPKTT